VAEIDAYITTLPQLEAAVHRLAAKIGAPAHLLPMFDHIVGDATPFIDQRSDGFHLVISERGTEYERVVSPDAKEILRLVFDGVTFSMASSYELAHRIEGQDCRRLIFSRQVELLSMISAEWAAQNAREHEATLRAHPFDDASSARVDLTKKLRGQGAAPDDAWREACDQYPLPVGE
jgi:hypothetical protein